MKLDEKALGAAIIEGSNMAGERLVTQIVTAYLEALGPGSTGETEGLTAYAQGVMLLGLAREIGAGTRSYTETYERGHILVGLGIAEYADTLVKGTSYWLRLTDAGRAMLSAAQGE